MASSTAQTEDPKPSHTVATTAKAPFNLPSADVVFRTADNVEFHLHKPILSIASPFFNDMFSLTQPSEATTQTTPSHERVPITENSETFDGLLRLLYPVADPPLTDRILVEQMLEAALKYQLKEATDTLRRAWQPFIPQHTLSIFATACRLHLQDEAKMAAEAWKATKSWSLDRMEPNFGRTLEGASYTDEMASMSAGTYFRLLYFLRTTVNGPVNFVEPRDPSVLRMWNLSGLFQSGLKYPNTNAVHTAPFPVPDVESDIILRTCDGVDVPAHRLVILLASATGLLTRPSSSSPKTYHVDAVAVTLRALLHLCYPLARVDFSLGLHQVDAVMRLARKYEIQSVVDLIKDQCVSLLPENPILCYFFAMQWEWVDEARKAAAFISDLEQPACVTDVYTSAMEDISAEIYVQLLKYVHQCKIASSEAVDSLPTHIYDKNQQWKLVAGEFNGVITAGIPLIGAKYIREHSCYECINRPKPGCRCQESVLNQQYAAYVRFKGAIKAATSKVPFEMKFNGVNA
ncbi:hypothetical protein BC835DRAFT_1413196 [Cytidiella melzeri]|nr:hypothetical protein BC835DRAFT_1413196 [Cytidiella melzeri]